MSTAAIEPVEKIMPSSSYAYFGLRGEFDPNELAAKIGIVPTRCVAKHSKDLERKVPRCSILRFAQTHAGDDGGAVNVYDLAEAVCEVLYPHQHRIVELLKDHDVEATLQVVLYFPVSDEVSTPAIGFSKKVVSFLSGVGGSIDIDSYRE